MCISTVRCKLEYEMFDIKKWKCLNQLEGHFKNNFEPFWELLREKSVSAPGFLICMAKIEAKSITLGHTWILEVTRKSDRPPYTLVVSASVTLSH